jgi:hypothetical protein
MTKFALVLVIACGVVLGQLAMEVLGLLVNWIGKLVGLALAGIANRANAARQELVLAAAAAAARQRPPIVQETGRDVNENIER